MDACRVPIREFPDPAVDTPLTPKPIEKDRCTGRWMLLVRGSGVQGITRVLSVRAVTPETARRRPTIGRFAVV